MTLNPSHRYLIGTLLILASCSPTSDMQGQNPKDYYTKHPIKNLIERHSQGFTVEFPPKEARLPVDDREALRGAMSSISPMAVEAVQIQMSDLEIKNVKRKDYMRRLLRSMGYTQASFMFEPSPVLARDEVRIDVTYALVIAPNCPDWRMSSVTTYSNSWQANYGCASITNLGMMVADPHDLVKGTGRNVFETEPAARALSDMRAGRDAASAAGAGAASASAPKP
jgi:pilus biogenesis lipoprotein CpaD